MQLLQLPRLSIQRLDKILTKYSDFYPKPPGSSTHNHKGPSYSRRLLGRRSLSDQSFDDTSHNKHARKQTKQRNEQEAVSKIKLDHRVIGANQNLWTHHPNAPGSPLFLPGGFHIFKRLIEFLQAQYPIYGFQEVLTPTIFKRSLWEQSGHWANYRTNMFHIDGGTPTQGPEKNELSLKPMNCPGHCLLYASKRRSYRDLPLRFAEFSPLHRQEDSGTLRGLTRVTRFHQDDGHIFCRLSQLQDEVGDQLRFIKMAYHVFGLEVHKINLSTRPEGFIGNTGDWKLAEDQLRETLENSKMNWVINPADGAFYGPKIDVIVKDGNGREHQTATIQLDFQLPKRFELLYDTENDSVQEHPVMIHRAVLGSFERFIALLSEHYGGRWPFWLSPKQVVILTVGQDQEVLDYSSRIAALLDGTLSQFPRESNSTTFTVEIDSSGETIGRKIARAKDLAGPRYSVICIIGRKNVLSNTLDLDMSGMLRPEAIREDIRDHQLCPKDTEKETPETTSKAAKNVTNVTLNPDAFIEMMRRWTKKYL